MGRQRLLLVLILGLVIGAIVVISTLPTRLGLDLRGGTQLTLQVETTDKVPTITEQDMEAVQRVIADRVNELGVSETSVQQLGQNQLLVQLPGVSNPEQARRVLGETAQLEFRPQSPDTEQRFQVENQILQQHQLELLALQELTDTSSQTLLESATTETDATTTAGGENVEQEIQAVQQAIQDSNQAIQDLFTPADLTGQGLTDAYARPRQSGNLWEVVIQFDAAG
ncbi:MAG: protein translocase subunit SecD, partial [Cyanobacteria bacterium P01_C01_bin.147]